ncbi:hypothetical protein TRVL_09727 [Trypanosoma vivax]|nr:hypothetical protein TRVL_09727 [Trypanosoma vivax]
MSTGCASPDRSTLLDSRTCREDSHAGVSHPAVCRAQSGVSSNTAASTLTKRTVFRLVKSGWMAVEHNRSASFCFVRGSAGARASVECASQTEQSEAAGEWCLNRPAQPVRCASGRCCHLR